MAKLELIHPGEILREEFMEPFGLSANALAIALRVPATRISEIARCQRSISPETALRLSRYFGTTADLWLGLQMEYDLRLARRSVGEQVEKEIAPRTAA